MNLSSCPICKHELKIREVSCERCKITYKGDFDTSWLAAFSDSQLEFIKLFLLVQGNLKELQNQLGISYPTIKSRLADIIRLITEKEPTKDKVADVLADLEEGFINVEEAINMINTRRQK
ncbi:MAG: hypothetical protein CVU50_01455 [Candidatus Cloacimonetes bacterium HGW-Cloacimonetes-3]|nr:MAG: hypothetical protein CVU50_01455 [Candidatus Cloacimonetes bacterium HGW-Cloacimonetes-3]